MDGVEYARRRECCWALASGVWCVACGMWLAAEGVGWEGRMWMALRDGGGEGVGEVPQADMMVDEGWCYEDS